MPFDAFRGRQPAFRDPKRKPGPPHRIELDPGAPLAKQLACCILFDLCAQAGSIRDFVAARSFTFAGTAHTQSASPFGGAALGTSGSSFTDWLALNVGLPPSAVWSASYMAKFDGTGASSGLDGAFANTGGFGSGDFSTDFNSDLSNGVAQEGIFISAGNNQYCNAASTVFLTPAVTSFTTWARHTWTSNGATLSFYSNGVLQSSVAYAMTFGLAVLILGWARPMSDFFFWQQRTLSAAEVKQHAAEPFRVLRPKGSELGLVSPGTCPPVRPFSSGFSTGWGPFTQSCGGTVATRPSQMMTGVGP